jgi:PadR family transcriptional regulator, regulatory protein AphA
MQEDRPNRKVYYITKDGRLELRRWLLSEQGLTAYREPFLVQLFFSDQLENEEVISNLQAQLQAHEERLARYKTIGLPPFDVPDMKREWFFQRMTLEMGLRVEQAYIDWLNDCIERMRRL